MICINPTSRKAHHLQSIYFQAGKPLFNQFDVPSECAFSCGLANCASCILRWTPVQRAFEPPLQRAQAGMHLLLSKFLVLQCYSFSEKIVLYTCTYFSSRTLFEFLSFFLKDSKNISPHNLGYRTGGRQAWLRVEHPSPHVTKNHLLTKPLKHPNFKGCGCSYYQYITAAVCVMLSAFNCRIFGKHRFAAACVFSLFFCSIKYRLVCQTCYLHP